MQQLGTNKVIVTGALGWLGVSLVEALVKGLADHEALAEPRGDLRIRCLILPGQDGTVLKKISERIEVVSGDVRNPADCARLCEDSKGAILFHTAGIIHPRKVAEFYQINVDGTINLLAAAIKAGVRRA